MFRQLFENFASLFGTIGAIFQNTWWIAIPAVGLPVWYYLWINLIVGEFLSKIKYKVLSINVPTESEKSAKLAEAMFNGLHGISTTPTKWEYYWIGKRVEWFSFELVSINGEVRYLIRTPEYYKDMVESLVYAQYPDAEISEIHDYVDGAPDHFPNGKYNLFGTEYKLGKPDAYPLTTYVSFEGPTLETTVDPMAGLLEVMSNIRQGEQIWVQILARPVNDHWKKEGEHLVKKLIGAKSEEKKSRLSKALGPIMSELGDLFRRLLQAPFGVPEPQEKSEKKEEGPRSQMLFLSPGERNVVEAIEHNIAKIGFEVKLRFIYLAPIDVYKKIGKSRINGVRGGLEKPFSSQDLNSLRINKRLLSRVDYFAKLRTPPRQRRIMRYFKRRSFHTAGFVLNTEELATLWHFPILTVKAANLRRAGAKKGEAPQDIPFEQ